MNADPVRQGNAPGGAARVELQRRRDAPARRPAEIPGDGTVSLIGARTAATAINRAERFTLYRADYDNVEGATVTFTPLGSVAVVPAMRAIDANAKALLVPIDGGYIAI